MSTRKKIRDPFAKREAQKYDSPIPSREYILDYIQKKKRPLDYGELLINLQLNIETQGVALRRRLKAMLRDGQLQKLQAGLVWPSLACATLVGEIMQDKGRRSFVVVQGSGEWVPLAKGSGHPYVQDQYRVGDIVEVRVPDLKQNEYRIANIVALVQAKPLLFTGRFLKEAGISYVIPHAKARKEDILVALDKTKGAKHNDIVLVEVITHATRTAQPIGRIVEVLGNENTAGIEVDSAIHSFSLPCKWSKEIRKFTSAISDTLLPASLRGRLDLCHLPFVTIDGEDAKDFDDAVYCEPRKQGGWRLYVAIADVSFYVKEKTELDQEAAERGNSVYFPGKVIPMLPEKLSNNLCSLKPQVKRLVLVCELLISQMGKITRFHFHEGIICSQARLTYTKVAAIVEDQSAQLKKQYESLVPNLLDLKKLYQVLEKQRRVRGAIDFETVETKLVFNKKGKINRIEPMERNIAHRIIEECMLAANVATAKFFKKHKLPGIYRVHEGPSEEKLIDVRKFLNCLGYELNANKPTPKDYANILEAIKERDDSHIIQMVLLRSLSQAIYSPENIGHFGLAYTEYTHFTSPIRRYPDLLIHRQIRRVLRGKWTADPDKDDKQIQLFTQAAQHTSMTERRADDATRDVERWLKCQYLRKHVGEIFQAVISGVTNFGFFAQLRDYYVEGLVHVSDLHGDFYQYDPVVHQLKGERQGVTYRLGDNVKVRVAKVNVDERQIDFTVIDDTPKKIFSQQNTPKKKNRSPKKPAQENKTRARSRKKIAKKRK